MAPAIPSVELKLSYPLYAVDFDPQDANRLVVGGGGGANRSGVGNKISVLDVSNQEELQIVSEIELSRDEDSVNTIAVGPHRKNDFLIYTGINSSEDDIQKGKNEHFRVFSAESASKTDTAKGGPKITESSRTSLFATEDKEAYQRLLRVSGRVGAVATGTSKDPQIAVFDLPSGSSSGTAPKSRGNLELVREATDMDLVQISDDEYQLVYCDNYELHTLNITKDGIDGPNNIWTTPDDEATGRPRPVFRSIRYLTPTFVLAAANLVQSGGVVLQGFRLPSTSDKGKESLQGKARLAVSTKLPGNVKRATGLAVRNLTPSTSPADSQFVIAVSDHQNSITLYTLEHQCLSGISLITKLHVVTTLKNVHPAPISGIAFSHSVPPASSSSVAQRPTLRLASIGSMGNTLAVHTLPLRKFVASNNLKTRYVLALKSHGPRPTQLLIFTAIFALLASILVQGALELNGLAKPRLGTRNFLPESWHVKYVFRDGSVAGPSGGNHFPKTTLSEQGGSSNMLAELLGQQQGELIGDKQQVVLSADKESGEVTVQEGEALHGKLWEELGKKQQEAWKKVLKGAGHWGEDVGEAVFKGVLFGEIGGLVANVVGG
ncbi:hypothetical protein QBC42DRAFT_270164 [Cladorrhinum samala]|uniref:Guanine nucleotide-exchange factor SEC12 n=1 Tax=Cladorrhinum samala TaxID=585594 RepID=A0AAV9HR02_9PEZI|nr:hypothetical protein QBC42DRAFT_270164 [Cladorrhinum samala]